MIKIIIGDINDFNSELYIHQQYQKMKRWTGDPFYIPVYKYAFEDVTELCEDVAMISDTFTTEIETKKRGYACAIELVDGTINLMHGIAITKYKLQTGKVI